MSEAAFFYNFTTQIPDRSKAPSAHTNISVHSQAQPVQHTSVFRKSHRSSKSSSNSKSNSNSKSTSDSVEQQPESLTYSTSNSYYFSSVTEQPTTTTSTSTTTPSKGARDRMYIPSTPLPDYKHAANQSSKARSQTQALAQGSNRKSSSTGGSSRSKHAISIAESPATFVTRSDAVGRSSSISSNTASSGLLTAVTSHDAAPADVLLTNPFVLRNGRRCLRDPAYPLPSDLHEIHRQTLRTMVFCQVFNGPLCSPSFRDHPPKKVLDVGCGTGFWSIMCHRHFSQKGWNDVSFTGMDLAPLALTLDSEEDMNWRFVQHDITKCPWPFQDDSFDLIFMKDMSFCAPVGGTLQITLMDEFIRVVKPGGTVEVWDGDHVIRLLLPHDVPSETESADEITNEDQAHANAMGVYKLKPQTPLAEPQNQYLLDFNSYVINALEAKNLTSIPCTYTASMLLQEEELIDVGLRRLAIPLGEVRWEREGVGGMNGKGKEGERRILTPGQAAIRRTALLTLVNFIESMEPLLRAASGKGQDEWDRWGEAFMTDLLGNNGTEFGECLEIGAWWAKKKKR
ncbi:hypothetical protein HYALB_00013181 [Hymenoscyphus albidus]|uniref:Methyltransferase domain-containing protein n=1 Tax=Hymenoscyphus albidus TaxID=595503 RepID=A0A9N9LXJ0_9HELO|nr:hypothetical protein HYALB_00013181 [Hymenoscyphus albidus]